MAVARIHADKPWFTRTVKALKPNGEWRSLRRELVRAHDRPGLSLELGADELRGLLKLFPYDTRLLEALGRLEVSEASEAARPRGVGLHSRLR